MKALLGIRQGHEETPLGEPGLHPSPQAAPGGTQAEPKGQGCRRTPHIEPALREEKCAGRIMSAGTRVKKSGVLFTFNGPGQICIGEGKGAQ